MRLQSFLIAALVFFKLTWAMTPQYLDVWVIWDIGQGQWVSHIQSDSCRHFDAGGEIRSFQRIKKSLMYFCGQKQNELILSHWDLDHFFNIPILAKSVPKLCWRHRPEFAADKPDARKILDLQIPSCSDTPVEMWLPVYAKSTNESSAVFMEQNILLPGDSPTTEEKLWSQLFRGIENTKILVLGHHGSRSSTGRELLSTLPNLTLAVSSARYARYRHPHFETVKRLSEFYIPMIRTEDWGNLWLTP